MFPGFYALRQRKNTQHGSPIKTANVDRDEIINKVDDMNLKEELRSCHHFLVESELEQARHKMFKYAMKNLDATIVDESLDHFFNNLKYTTKMNLVVVSFCFENIEVGRFRFFYEHQSKILLDGSKLKPIVCLNEDFTKLKDILKKLTSPSCAVEKDWTQRGKSTILQR